MLGKVWYVGQCYPIADKEPLKDGGRKCYDQDFALKMKLN